MQQPLAWDDLRLFLALARTGQIAHAATALGVNPTTVSRGLRRLQERLGQTLFEHGPAGRVLTEDGERLLRHVEAMQRAADRVEEASRAPHGLAGILRVSVSEGFGTAFIAGHIQDFVARHPALTVELVATSGFLNPSRREADLAVMLARPQAGPVVSSKLSNYALRLYASHAYLNRHGPPADVTALADRHRLIGYVPDLLYSPELNYLGEMSPGLVAHVRSSSINAQHRMIAAGVGIGVLPRFIGDADDALRPILPDLAFTRSFWVVTHQDTRQLMRVRAFRLWLFELVRRHRTTLLGEAD